MVALSIFLSLPLLSTTNPLVFFLNSAISTSNFPKSIESESEKSQS
jgi:hypothetical protein